MIEDRNPLQRCRQFIPGLRSMPWWDAADFPVAGVLAENYPLMRAELLNLLLCGQLRLHPQSKGGPRAQISDGDWNIFELLSGGQVSPASALLAPGTSRILQSLPEVTTNPSGLAYFSVLSPGVHIMPHCGPTNSRIRIHLGLVVPVGATMRVGTETRPWREGACVVFDDSWEHEVVNRSEFLRAVLLLDVWHPDITFEQVSQIVSARGPGAARRKQRAGWLDEARLHEDDPGPSLRAMVGPGQLGRMAASVGKAVEAGDRVFSTLSAFAAEALTPPAARRALRDHPGLPAELWSGLAAITARQPGLLSDTDVINIVHVATVFWRSSAANELLGWEFMERGPAVELERLFTAARRLQGRRAVLDWCHEGGASIAPLTIAAAAAALALQDPRQDRLPGAD
jgi:aspartyl/asparaginyl beta-hydroxylase (cupin superfamily)